MRKTILEELSVCNISNRQLRFLHRQLSELVSVQGFLLERKTTARQHGVANGLHYNIRLNSLLLFVHE